MPDSNEDEVPASEKFLRFAKAIFAVPKAELDELLANERPKLKTDGTPKRKPGPRPKNEPGQTTS